MIDYNDMLDHYDREQERWLGARPKCCLCDEPIQTDRAVYLNDEWYCDDCIKDARKFIEE